MLMIRRLLPTHRLAELVARLGWSSPYPGHYVTGYTEPVLEAVHRIAVQRISPAGGTR